MHVAKQIGTQGGHSVKSDKIQRLSCVPGFNKFYAQKNARLFLVLIEIKRISANLLLVVMTFT